MLTLSILGGGCATDDGSPDDIAATSLAPTEVTRVTTPDGGTWRFLEAEPGELVLWGTMSEGKEPLPTDGSLDRLSFVDIYRRLTPAPVPHALLDAQARADARTETETGADESGLVDEATDSGKDTTTTQITASDFQYYYCWDYSWDFSYCWPSTGGNPKVQHKTYSMWGHVAAVDHTVNFRFRYKRHSSSSWTTLVSAQALPGQVHVVHQSYNGYRRWRVWEVFDNPNAVRYSCVGDD